MGRAALGRAATGPGGHGPGRPRARAASAWHQCSGAGGGEHVVEGLEEEVGVFALEDKGGPDLQHVSGRAGGTEQYPPFAHCLGHRAGAPGCGSAGRLVIDELDAEQETFAPDVPDDSVAVREFHQAPPEVGAHLRGVGGQMLVLDDGEDCERGRAGDRVAAEGAEQLGLLGNRTERLGPDYQGGDREAVTHRFSHHHHVRLDP